MSAGAWLLADALTELRPRSLQTLTPDQYAARADTLRDIDLIVFDRWSPPQLPAVPTLSFGTVPARGLPLRTAPDATSATSALVWQRSHPILRHVALESLYVARTLGLTLIKPTSADQPTPAATELIRGRHSALLVLIQDRAVQRLVAGFDLAQSNWPLQAGFPIFLANAVDSLTLRGQEALGRAFRTDEPVLLRAPPTPTPTTPTSPPLTLRATPPIPDVAVPITRSKQTTPDPTTIALGLFTRAGVYTVQPPPPPDQPAADAAIAVNLLDETESRLLAPSALTIAGRPLPGVAETTTPRELWRWCALAALATLAVEWLLYARLLRNG